MPDDAPIYRSTRSIVMVHGELFYERHRSCVCPAYDLDERGQVNLFGSVILVRIAHLHFAISGKRVVELLSDRALIIGADGPVEIGKPQFFFTRGTSGRTDRFDLAFGALTATQVRGLGDCQYLSLSQLDSKERPDYSRPMGSKYFVLGYPGSAVALPKPGALAVPASLVVPALPAGQGTYAKLGLVEHGHLLLDLDRKSVSDPEGPVTAPSFRGLTGGAWSAPRDLNPSQPPERLLGFFVEYEAGGLKTIVVTRIGAALEGIKRSFPPLRDVLAAT